VPTSRHRNSARRGAGHAVPDHHGYFHHEHSHDPRDATAGEALGTRSGLPDGELMATSVSLHGAVVTRRMRAARTEVVQRP
jgi:hypothetical protein